MNEFLSVNDQDGQGRLISERLGFIESNDGYSKEIGGDAYSFSRITDINELEATTTLQQEVFELSERDLCPAHMLVTLNKLGGIVLGVQNSDGEQVGFSYTWPTVKRGVFLLDMIGIREDLRDKGLGYETMKALFLEASKEGAEEIQFTYDPLKVRNASIYLRKMGARVVSFEQNPYGGDLAGDRFLASWDISNNEITERFVNGINQDFVDFYTLPVATVDIFPDEEKVLLPAPEDNESLSEEELTGWRQFYRDVGAIYFPEYSAETFLTFMNDRRRENYYYLIRNRSEDYPVK